MAMMVRYCEKHRHAWPCADKARRIEVGGKKYEHCPLAPSLQAESCPIGSVDALAQITLLGLEIDSLQEQLDELVT